MGDAALGSYTRCGGTLYIEKPELRKNRASKECSNEQRCLQCCDAFKKGGGPRYQVYRHNQGRRETAAPSAELADLSPSKPDTSTQLARPLAPDTKTSYAKPLSMEYLQLLDAQDRNLRERKEAAEEQRARQRASDNFVRVQWWTEVIPM
ncbi:hypothetical protein FRB90_010733 [Tulasnella sp. 427]|nr:hypothetical protein FRB90_010733 [Tulasnella sp. 427]